MDNEAITEETENILSFAMDPMTAKQMIGRCRVCYHEGTYLTICGEPENVFEQFLRTEETEEHLIGKKHNTDDSDNLLAPGLPEFGIFETCRRLGRKWDICQECHEGYITLLNRKEIMRNLVRTCPICRNMGPIGGQCIRFLGSSYTQELRLDWNSDENPRSRNLYQLPGRNNEEDTPDIQQANISTSDANMLAELFFGPVTGPPTPTEVPDTFYPYLDCGERVTQCDGRCDACTTAYSTPLDETDKINALEREIKEQFSVNPFTKRQRESTFEKQRQKERLPPTKELLVKAREFEEKEEPSESTRRDGLTW
jgi:hypothetical protein